MALPEVTPRWIAVRMSVDRLWCRAAPRLRNLRLRATPVPNGPVHRHLRAEPHPVQQERRPPQRVPADMEQPPDQSGDPFQGPPLVLSPAPYRRAKLAMDRLSSDQMPSAGFMSGV